MDDDPLLRLDRLSPSEPARAALEVARLMEPEVDVDSELRHLDQLAGSLPGSTAGEVVDHVHRTLGFQGDREDYDAPANSLLHRVVARRLGMPITLAVVHLHLAGCVGAPAVGIGFPGHFLVRYGGDSEEFLVDPFAGRFLSAADLTELASRVLGRPAEPDRRWLRPVSALEIAARILRNLEASLSRRGDEPGAWRAATGLEVLSLREGVAPRPGEGGGNPAEESLN